MSATRALNRSQAASPGVTDFRVDHKRRLVIVRFGNEVGMAEIAAYAQKLLSNPEFRPDFSEITDLSEVVRLELQAEEFIKLADDLDPFSIEAKRAFVVQSSVQAHAARMHKALRAQRNFAIFRSFEEAERWIAE